MVFCVLILFTSCSDDDNDDRYFIGSKDDIEFKGKSLEEVREALEGTWAAIDIYSDGLSNSILIYHVPLNIKDGILTVGSFAFCSVGAPYCDIKRDQYYKCIPEESQMN